jgi:hypothetical protein
MTRALVAWGPVAVARLLLDPRAVGERAQAVARDERLAVARQQRRRRQRLVGIAADPLSGRSEVPVHRSAKRRAEQRLGGAAGASRGLNGAVKTVMSGMLLALASVMLQRAYARSARRRARRDRGGGRRSPPVAATTLPVWIGPQGHGAAATFGADPAGATSPRRAR